MHVLKYFNSYELGKVGYSSWDIFSWEVYFEKWKILKKSVNIKHDVGLQQELHKRPACWNVV